MPKNKALIYYIFLRLENFRANQKNQFLLIQNVKKKLNLSHFKQLVLLIFIYFVVASASFQGYFSRWGFYYDTTLPWTLENLFDRTVNDSFVLRELIPEISKAIDERTPVEIKHKVSKQFLHFVEITYRFNILNSDYKFRYMFRYFIVYLLAFICLFASMFLLRKLCIDIVKDPVSSTLAPICMALSFALFQNRGGYFYDFSELMFFALAMLLAYHKKLLWLLLLIPLATLNKETFPLFVVTLFPIIKPLISRNRMTMFVFSSIIISIIVGFIIKNHYLGSTHWKPALMDISSNIKFWLNPRYYLFISHRPMYSTIAPSGSSIFNIFIVYSIVSSSWKFLSVQIKQHTFIALLINVPLMFFFCNKDELRNLSLLYVSLTIMIAFYIKNLIEQN